MVEAFKTLDLAVLAPILLGAAACMLLLSRAINALLGRAYTGTFHCILGIVLASTLMIVPTGYNYLQPATFFCVAAAVAGGALAYWMSKLEG
jgi:putative membrane protein